MCNYRLQESRLDFEGIFPQTRFRTSFLSPRKLAFLWPLSRNKASIGLGEEKPDGSEQKQLKEAKGRTFRRYHFVLSKAFRC